jgi:hypothetical protein
MVFTIDSRYFFPSGAFVGWTIHCLLDLARDVLDQSRTQRDDWLWSMLVTMVSFDIGAAGVG